MLATCLTTRNFVLMAACASILLSTTQHIEASVTHGQGIGAPARTLDALNQKLKDVCPAERSSAQNLHDTNNTQNEGFQAFELLGMPGPLLRGTAGFVVD